VLAGDETRAAETLRLERRGGRLGRRIVTPVHAGDGQHAARWTRNRLFHQLFKSNVTGPIGGVRTRRKGNGSRTDRGTGDGIRFRLCRISYAY